ncbi:MAG: DUF6452 family protein [Bacteroidia bacterium]|nr:DUF6452 family protein [Bacteroidia bacterium]
MRFSLFIISLLIFGMVSCNDGNRCYDSVDTLMVTSFSVNGYKSIKTMVINGVDRNDVGDILVNDTDSALTKRYPLPLSLSADSTGFVLKANGKKDTLYIRHTMIISFISENCGFAPNYVISGFRYTKGIDSVKISDTKVNPNSILKKTNDQNISIYFNSAAH